MYTGASAELVADEEEEDAPPCCWPEEEDPEAAAAAAACCICVRYAPALFEGPEEESADPAAFEEESEDDVTVGPEAVAAAWGCRERKKTEADPGSEAAAGEADEGVAAG